MTDIVELIHAEHVRISKLVGKLDSALMEPGLADPGSEPGLIWAALARFLRLHVDAAEEIAYQALASGGPDAVLAIMQASETNAEICEEVEEAGLSVPGSRTWHMAVQAACRGAHTHIACVESGPLTRYQLHAVPATRQALGRQWLFFVTARGLDASVRLSRPPQLHQGGFSGEDPEVRAVPDRQAVILRGVMRACSGRAAVVIARLCPGVGDAVETDAAGIDVPTT